ncbi:UNVERIFIED_CONTAM: Magnesium dechelatase SGRL, chloroplastic [Sesamum latifolium]|uniref:Magnesium dechelatase SGRL, chloroplastic n=1 Tax=Sesamum latifolium TaxID=2727402 RepID=A0AAW2VRG7_9LAMI
MQSMATHTTAFSPSFIHNCKAKPSPPAVLFPHTLTDPRPSYNSLVFQLKGWYNKDDVVAEWTEVNGILCLNVHCYVSGPNSLSDLAAEFRYHIFSKELPLVLEAVLYGDSDLFSMRQELMDAIVRVFFHSSSKKYNRVECWGPLKDAVLGKVDKVNGFVSASKGENKKTLGKSKINLPSTIYLPAVIL